MVTTLYEVKKSHGGYDGETSTQPTVTFDSANGYSIGYALIVTDGTSWVCDDATIGAAVWTQDEDGYLTTKIIQITEMLFDYLNNPFFGNRSTDSVYLSDVVFASATATSTGNFVLSDTTRRYYVGDNIRIVGSIRNDGFYDVSAITDDMLTVDREFSIDITDLSSVYFSLIAWPSGLSGVAAEMVAYDYYVRDNDGKTSESIGNYSYTKEDVTLSGIAYPSSVVAGLMVYKVPKYV